MRREGVGRIYGGFGAVLEGLMGSIGGKRKEVRLGLGLWVMVWILF